MKASASLTIDRPIEEVFAFTADLGLWDQWVEGVTNLKRTDEGALGPGSTFSSKYAYSGQTHDVTYEFTQFEPPFRHTVKVVSGPMPFEGIMELESTNEGTIVTNSIDTGSATPRKLEKFAPIVRIALANRLGQELQNLKSCLEN